MKKCILMVISIFLVNSMAFAKKEKLIDARNMTMKERLKLMTDLRIAERNKSVPVGDQSTSFLQNLKDNGVSGISTSKEMVFGSVQQEFIEKEQGKAPSQTFDKISGAMSADGGKIKEYRQVSAREQVDGKMKKLEYIIEYENGSTQRLEFMYIQPDISGGFKLMEVKVVE